jgi:diketogulonate reductase-like aldo/keto reductase
MLWAWETPEDLRGIDVSQTGVALLVGEIRLGDDVTVRARMQPVVLEPGTWVMAVARVEPTAKFVDSETMRAKTAKAIVGVAAQRGVGGVQVDFDATATQRDFYAAVLREVRRAKRKGVTPAQFALAWLLAQKPWIVPIPSTTKMTRMEENIGAADVELTTEDLKQVQDATSKLSLEGARLPEAMLKMTGR